MKKVTTKANQRDEGGKRQLKDIRKLLNLNYLSLLNKTYCTGEFDLPVLYCNPDVLPDYLALYTQPGDYHKTPLTGVCFYLYDSSFDGPNGLFNAIYYSDKKRLQFYKERFTGIKFFISPDYSQFGDLHKMENLVRLWKARIVSLWLTLEMHAIVIPNITYISEETFPLFCCGLEECRVVAFSTKGHVRNANERKLTKAAVKYVTDHLPLKSIVVYSVCGEDKESLELFRYAADHGIQIAIPDNMLRERNMRRNSL